MSPLTQSFRVVLGVTAHCCVSKTSSTLCVISETDRTAVCSRSIHFFIGGNKMLHTLFFFLVVVKMGLVDN